MKRYHGGVLDKKSEDRRKFYQGEAQLLNIFMDPTAFPLLATHSTKWSIAGLWTYRSFHAYHKVWIKF